MKQSTEWDHIRQALASLSQFEHDRTLDHQMQRKLEGKPLEAPSTPPLKPHCGDTVAQIEAAVDKVAPNPHRSRDRG